MSFSLDLSQTTIQTEEMVPKKNLPLSLSTAKNIYFPGSEDQTKRKNDSFKSGCGAAFYWW